MSGGKAPTRPITTAAHPPRPFSVYTVRKDPPGSLIAGHHIYRLDPGENVFYILAQGMDEDEARVCVEALNKLAPIRATGYAHPATPDGIAIDLRVAAHKERAK